MKPGWNRHHQQGLGDLHRALGACFVFIEPAGRPLGEAPDLLLNNIDVHDLDVVRGLCTMDLVSFSLSGLRRPLGRLDGGATYYEVLMYLSLEGLRGQGTCLRWKRQTTQSRGHLGVLTWWLV